MQDEPLDAWLVSILREVAFWLKSVYPEEEGEAQDFWRRVPWVSDAPGRQSPRWQNQSPPSWGDVYPPFGPRWEVGDRLVVYLVGRDRCPAILEVAAEPRWDPELVDRDGGPGEGDRWGVVTDTRSVVGLEDDGTAPRLAEIHVEPASIAQKGRLALDERQYREAERLLWGASSDRNRSDRSDLVALERGGREGYDVRSPEGIRRATRRESQLVTAYADVLARKGDNLWRNRLLPKQGGAPLYTDLFNVTRNQLVEAKSGTARNDVRMAIGQLADYRRFLEPRPSCGVLLEDEPDPDLLDLLEAEGIAVVWRESDGFADSRGSEFT